MRERNAVGGQREWSGEQFAFAAEQGITQHRGLKRQTFIIALEPTHQLGYSVDLGD